MVRRFDVANDSESQNHQKIVHLLSDFLQEVSLGGTSAALLRHAYAASWC